MQTKVAGFKGFFFFFSLFTHLFETRFYLIARFQIHVPPALAGQALAYNILIAIFSVVGGQDVRSRVLNDCV